MSTTGQKHKIRGTPTAGRWDVDSFNGAGKVISEPPRLDLLIILFPSVLLGSWDLGGNLIDYHW